MIEWPSVTQKFMREGSVIPAAFDQALKSRMVASIALESSWWEKGEVDKGSERCERKTANANSLSVWP